MSFIYIAEYTAIGKSSGNTTQAPLEPPKVEQKITFSSSAQSGTLDPQTRVVRVHVDADSHIALGANPTATTSNRKLIAGQTEYLSIPQGSNLKIAAIDA